MENYGEQTVFGPRISTEWPGSGGLMISGDAVSAGAEQCPASSEQAANPAPSRCSALYFNRRLSRAALLAAESFRGSWGSTPNCATCFAARGRDRFRVWNSGTLWAQCKLCQCPVKPGSDARGQTMAEVAAESG